MKLSRILTIQSKVSYHLENFELYEVSSRLEFTRQLYNSVFLGINSGEDEATKKSVKKYKDEIDKVRLPSLTFGKTLKKRKLGDQSDRNDDNDSPGGAASGAAADSVEFRTHGYVVQSNPISDKKWCNFEPLFGVRQYSSL